MKIQKDPITGFYNYKALVDYKTANKFLKKEFGKKWHDKINLTYFNQKSTSFCVLGQLSNREFDGFGYVMQTCFNGVWYQNGVFGAKTSIDWFDRITKRKAKFAQKVL